MNFFDAQKQAKSSTTYLVIIFLIGLALFTTSVSLLVMGVYHYYFYNSIAFSTFNSDAFMRLFITIAFIVFVASLFQFFTLKEGGKVIALSLRGKLITPLSHDKSHRILLNVVEEMAIASGISPPNVYLLPDSGINAFAAGFNYDDAVIGVTQGALDQLNREELQGVIAHEYSHIFNGDMRLNLHLIGMVSGIVFIGAIGRFLLEALHESRVGHYSSSSSDSKKGDPIVALYLLGLGLMILGWIGTIIGEWIKAMISRQREYLADASAVQYTRYPKGLANALIKIGANAQGSSIQSSAGGTYAHLFFADGISNFWDHLFSTHPRLEDRIRRIDPSWNGEFTPEKSSSKPKVSSSTPESSLSEHENIASTLTSPIAFDTLSRIAQQPGNQNISTIRTRLDALPNSLHTMSANALSAQWIVLALLLSAEKATLLKQQEYLENSSPMMYKNIQNTYKEMFELPRSAHLDLLNLSLPSLRMMSKQQYNVFRQMVIDLIDMDNVVSLWEWSLHAIVITPLDREFGLTKVPKERYKKIEELEDSVTTLFSLLIYTQFSDEKRINKSIETLRISLALPTLTYKANISHDLLNKTLNDIRQASTAIRTLILEQSIAVLSSEGTLYDDDVEIIHALGALLLLPLSSFDFDITH
ncbi:MAG: M48 family metallopeptidase [Sulfuricurvum sp.]|uniref:M48 family metallopeptidase n=1 Tax=Sulfuricurvum sp. TaxID=2025608 RepID=UPI00260A2D90|nr:M48 family metallopeptidase [Sulfuricurvum sp.]MDD2830248.1 M48 family metallopeptidase [Sulfuricurvum sp.]MDD4948780.1 M48 family metallopeptidase [Sulfuricurvum sp.]